MGKKTKNILHDLYGIQILLSLPNDYSNYYRNIGRLPILLYTPATPLSTSFAFPNNKRPFTFTYKFYSYKIMNSLLEINTSSTIVAENILVANNFDMFNSIDDHCALCPDLLTDTSRLPEIFNLRLNVWEHSGNNEFVNRKLYPNGWYDHLDKSAFHWVVVNNEDKIIASARLNLFNSLEEFPYYRAVKDLSFPEIMPFGFFSRLVVHPHYRQIGLSRQLFDARSIFCAEKKIRWTHVFINNPAIIRQFKKSGYQNIGQAGVSYHPASEPHLVNVFIKENRC